MLAFASYRCTAIIVLKFKFLGIRESRAHIFMRKKKKKISLDTHWSRKRPERLFSTGMQPERDKESGNRNRVHTGAAEYFKIWNKEAEDTFNIII